MDVMDDGAELHRLQFEIQRRSKQREPARIGDVLSRLIAQRGYLQTLNSAQLRDVWASVAGPQLAGGTQPGNLRRGVLDVYANDSCLLQELTFRKAQLLKAIQKIAPEMKIRDLRFRSGFVE